MLCGEQKTLSGVDTLKNYNKELGTPLQSLCKSRKCIL